MFEVMERNRRDFVQYFRNYTYNTNFLTPKWLSVFSTEIYEFYVPIFAFYFVPNQWTGIDPESEPFIDAVSNVTTRVARALRVQGLLDLTVGSVSPCDNDKQPKFFIISFTNTRFTFYPMAPFIIDSISRLGALTGPGFVEIIPPGINVFENTSVPFPNFPHRPTYETLVNTTMKTAFDHGIFFNRSTRLWRFADPVVLHTSEEAFDFCLPYVAGIEDVPNKITGLFNSIIKYSPHWAHPYFIFNMASGLDPYTMIADYIVPVLNTPMITFSDSSAKPFLLMEKELVNIIGKRVYGEAFDGDGTITDGGSMGNQLAMALARARLGIEGFQNVGNNLNPGQRYIVYMSSDAHDSIRKGSLFQSIGLNNTVIVEADVVGKMQVSTLQEAIDQSKSEGNIPIMVVITAGTSIFGAIDNINLIVDICILYGIWCHVDGAFGGFLGISDLYRFKFDGIERADSWSASLHKLLGSAMVCSIFITRDRDTLATAFNLGADAEQEDAYDEGGVHLNLVGRHPQLDKRNNVFKFWFLWKAKGRRGLAEHVDRVWSNKDFLIAEIGRRRLDGFELLISEFELANVCFIYTPPHLNPNLHDIDVTSPIYQAELNNFHLSVEKEFLQRGVASFITQNRLRYDGTVTNTFFKFTMTSTLTEDDIRFLLDAVIYHAGEVDLQRKRLKTISTEKRQEDCDMECECEAKRRRRSASEL